MGECATKSRAAGQGEKDDNDRILQMCSALIIGFVCIVIGLPLWWFTTNVYRANLPYAAIEDLDKFEPVISVRCEVVVSQKCISETQFFDKLQSHLNNHLDNMDDSQNVVHPIYDITLRNSHEEEESIFVKVPFESVVDMEKQLSNIEGNYLSRGHYRIYVVSPSAFENHFAPNKTTALGLTRNVFIRGTSAEELAVEISRILKEVLVRESDLSETYLVTKRADQMKPNKDSMRSLKSSLGYDLIFTLMNPQPDVVSVHWDMNDAAEKFLNPVIRSLANYATINVRSQYLHLTGINAQSKYNPECKCFVLPTSRLPHIINPIESYLASHVTNNPTLNFVAYVPTREQSPLLIFDHHGNPSSTNAFLVPRWGGLLVHNVEISTTNDIPLKVEVNHKKMFSVFLAQLKSLLGFRKVSDDSIQIIRSSTQVIADWELDAWLFERSVENIGKTASTLQSLSLLLNHINNIVINDDVAQQVNTSVAAAMSSFSLLSKAQLEEAYLESRIALNSSEMAFFDSSLLELLYFPEDQKFAIYIPLFLPIGIPVINSIYQAIHYLKKRYFLC